LEISCRDLTLYSFYWLFSQSWSKDLITNPLVPYPFEFARLNASRSSASNSHSLSDPTTLKHHLVTMKHERYFEKILLNEHAYNTAHIDRKLSHWLYIGKSIWFTTQQQRHFPKRLKRNATCDWNAIEQSSKLLHESSEIRNKRQIQFRTILCLSPKWHLCLHAAFCPKWHPCNHNFKFQAA
jgi:hypothetical protein